jgi:hypothetical protein
VGGKRRLWSEWPRALIALGLATVLWLVVNAEEPATGWVRVRVGLTLTGDVALSEPAPPVHALITGKRRELLKLMSSPPTLQRAITDESTDSARLELRVQDVELPSGSDVEVRDIRPRLLRVLLQHASDTSRTGTRDAAVPQP